MQRKTQFKINLISKNLRDIYDWNLRLFYISLRFGDIEVCSICKCPTYVTLHNGLLKHHEYVWMIQVHHTTSYVWGLVMRYTPHVNVQFQVILINIPKDNCAF